MKDETIVEGGSLDLNYFEGGSLAKIESAAEQTAAFALTGFTLITLCRPSNQKLIDVICGVVFEEEKYSPYLIVFIRWSEHLDRSERHWDGGDFHLGRRRSSWRLVYT